MSKQCITAEGAPPALGPYSHAVKAGNLLFLSGQGSLAADGSGIIRGTIEEETHQTFSNIKTVLAAAGADLSDVVKVLVFLKDMDNFKAVNAVYAEYFPENPPARSCIEAARLPGDMQVEIEVIAMLSDH
ncbi:MAG: Rid family detoxifying hydrolase [Candidatus Hydrogenedentota bacterium]|jgi:2-iminobutanoate/2-iminopropanoate deaminase|nr:deaminase [Nitrospirales bacterium]